MEDTSGIHVTSHDVALRVDPIGESAYTAGEIDPGEVALAEREAVDVRGGVHIGPHNVALRVNPQQFRVTRPRVVNRSETALAQQKAVPGANRIQIPPDDLAFRVDVENGRAAFNGVGRPRVIDGGERTVAALVCQTLGWKSEQKAEPDQSSDLILKAVHLEPPFSLVSCPWSLVPCSWFCSWSFTLFILGSFFLLPLVFSLCLSLSVVRGLRAIALTSPYALRRNCCGTLYLDRRKIGLKTGRRARIFFETQETAIHHDSAFARSSPL